MALRHKLIRPDSLVEDAWMELGDLDGLEIDNPLLGRSKDELDNPGILEMRIMRDPDYLTFAAKTLLDIDLLPIQAVILHELWTKPFPMFCASRGFGKAVGPNELVRIKNGWKKIKDVEVGDKVYGGDGRLCNVTGKTNLQKDLNMYRITLRDGRTIDCCEDHQWKIWDKNKNRNRQRTTKKTGKDPGSIYTVLKTKDMIDNFQIKRTGEKSNGTEYRYAIPINGELLEEKESDLPLHPYIVGMLLGDGCVTQKTITITTADVEIVDRIKELLPNGYTIGSIKSAKYGYTITKTDKSLPSFYKLCQSIGIWGCNSYTKFVPDIYKYASNDQKLELIKGLNDADAHARANRSIIVYSTASEKLANDYMNIVRSLGIPCKKKTRKTYLYGKQCADSNEITVYTNKGLFFLPRKLEYLNHSVSKQGQSKYEKSFIVNIEYIGKDEGYCIMVDSPDNTYITKDYIVTHNSFMLAVYCSLRCALIPNTKIITVGSAFRQSKVIFDYMDTIYQNAPVLRSICSNNSGPRASVDRCSMIINSSRALFLPLGTGDKIRGQRANVIISDEMASIPPEIYETVVRGFAAVSAKPIDNVKAYYKQKAIEKLNKSKNIKDEGIFAKARGNQCIMAGTADYEFMHFAQYWKTYYTYIHSKGQIDKEVELPSGEIKRLRDYFPDGLDESFDYRDYSILRIPYELIPRGFMDDKVVAAAKASSTKSTYLREYGAVFPADSDGFFKRSLIQSCVGTDVNPVKLNDQEIYFDAATQGIPGKTYVYGVDPAAESDNFSIVVLEIWPDHVRIVYCWTTNVADFQKRRTSGIVNEHDYYSFCARKIRNLMKVFPTENIALDAQGGGRAILEALHDPHHKEPSEDLLWPTNDIMNPGKELPTDRESGKHIIHLCQFVNFEFLSAANHGTRKDFEDKCLLFPRFDPVTLELSAQKDATMAKQMGVNSLYDTLEDCVMEIEQLKDELCSIVMTRTANNNRDRWDTPETTTEGGKKKRMRKDRYSSLIMANYIARSIKRAPQDVSYNVMGGFTHQIKGRKNEDKRKYAGPAWYAEAANKCNMTAIKKRY